MLKIKFEACKVSPSPTNKRFQEFQGFNESFIKSSHYVLMWWHGFPIQRNMVEKLQPLFSSPYSQQGRPFPEPCEFRFEKSEGTGEASSPHLEAFAECADY